MSAHGTPAAPSPSEVVGITDRLFREESAKLIAVLTRMFGLDRLQLAEDVVQEAMARAMQTWPYYGVPDNPAAWLTQTAKNLALDVVRRDKRFREKQPSIKATFGAWAAEPVVDDTIFFDDEINDGRLRLMFACCHPVIPAESRVALALKTLCGFGVREIANAFLATEAATAKRLTRARQKIRESKIRFEIPTGDALSDRLESVEQTLYLLFNEGYKASTGDTLVRDELCHEAIVLTALLAEHPAGNRPRTHALLALMLLNAARLPARTDDDGGVLLLKDQDRECWNRAMIVRGMSHLARASEGEELTPYHLQAGIAAIHCAAPDYASTDWPRILAAYDLLMAIEPSPVVALNRAVAITEVRGPQAGMDAIEAMRNRGQLDDYYLLYAVLADFSSRLDDHAAAANHIRRAIQLTDIPSERAFLARRLESFEAQAATK